MRKLTLLILLFIFHNVFAQQSLEFNIQGLKREAILYKPTKLSKNTPVVFVFHGHGGNAKHASNKMNFQDFYKEAVVVFMEGIPGTSGYVIDKEGKMNGWQMFPNQNENRDVLFFDEVLKYLKMNFKTADVFAAGHSNGARFVNVLWKERPEELSAIISVAAQGGIMIRDAKPLSVWMSMGKNDPLVPFNNQKNSVPIVQKSLKINPNTGIVKGDKTYFKGKSGKELVVEEREAGHKFPEKSIPEMVEFMKSNAVK